MTSTRPTGVTVIAILAAISGAFAVLGGLALLGLGAVGGAMGGPLLAFFGTFGGIIILALGVVTLYAAWGAWNLKVWAWTLLVVLTAIGLVLSLFSLRSSFLSLIVNAVILYYLFRPEVKAAFQRT